MKKPIWVVLIVIGIVMGLFFAGRSFTARIGDTELSLNQVDNRVATLEGDIKDLHKQLSVAAVYDVNRLISESKFLDGLAAELANKTGAQVVTIYAINYDTKRRRVIGMWPESKRENMLIKEKRLWSEGYRVAEAILGDVAISVVERLPKISELQFNTMKSERPYYIYNDSAILTDPAGMAEVWWDKTLGNQVTYTVGKIGIRPMTYIAIDYNAANAEEAKKNMRNTMLYAPDACMKVTRLMVQKNPAITDLEWLFEDENIKS